MKRLDRAPPRSNKAKRKRLAALRRQNGRLGSLAGGDASSLTTQIERERREAAARRRAADAALAAARRHTRNPFATLERLREGRSVELPPHSPLAGLGAVYRQARTVNRLQALHRLASVGLRQRLFRSPDAERDGALLSAALLEAAWLREPEAWKPRGKNQRKQLSSLLRHLFARYEVPRLFDQAFFDGGALQQRWFLHLGRGQNLRTAPELPTTLTKKMAHHALRAPGDCSILQALRWGQLIALGGSPQMAAAAVGTRLAAARSFDDDAFWVTVLRFFAQHPLLDTQHYGPIVDYLAHARRERPSFAMKGRSPAALLDRVAAWHRQLGWERHGDHVWERPRGLADLDWTPPDPNDPLRPGPITWQLVPLLGSGALREEGRALQHCVATYGGSCQRGSSSIWSLRKITPKRETREATIEVSHRGPRPLVVQVRGKRNAIPKAGVWLVVDRWLRGNRLEVAPYVPRS